MSAINKMQSKMQTQLREQQAQLGKQHKVQEEKIVFDMNVIEERTHNREDGAQVVEGVDMRQVEAVLHAVVFFFLLSCEWPLYLSSC